MRPTRVGEASIADARHESGTFVIYNLQQRVGTEQYTISSAGDTVTTRAKWEFRYLGGGASLESELTTSASGQPRRFRLHGATSTWTTADVEIEIDGAVFRARSDSTVQRGSAARHAFPGAPYAPIAVAQATYRHWLRAGRPPRVPLLPDGEVTFAQTGTDTVRVNGQAHRLSRYLVTGLVWGRQSLWIDSTDRVIAAVGGNAELDRSEYVREGFEAALPHFVRRSVEDGMAAIAALGARVTPTHRGSFAIRNVRIVDATGAPPIEHGTVIVGDGRISAVGATARTPIPRGIAIIDGTGKTVLPGLWDMHVHYEQVEWPLVSLASGVTTVRDAANEFELITALRAAQRAGRILSPNILAAGVIDGGSSPLGVVVANTEQEARAAVRRYHAEGFEQIKIYGSLSPALVPVVTDEAHRLGLTVTGHVPRGMTTRAFIEAGADQLNHGGAVFSLLRNGREPLDWESATAKDGVRLLRERRIAIDPTQARAEEGGHWRGHYERVEPGVLRVPRELRDPLQSTGRDSTSAVRSAAAQLASAQMLKGLRDRGVPIVLGTDLAVPGFSIYRELELAVQGGFTPMEAIQSATIESARAMRLGHDVGTIEVGKRADLILVDGNPLQRIEEIRRVRSVIIGGRVYRSADLWRLAGFSPP